jgi:hypothetical protein
MWHLYPKLLIIVGLPLVENPRQIHSMYFSCKTIPLHSLQGSFIISENYALEELLWLWWVLTSSKNAVVDETTEFLYGLVYVAPLPRLLSKLRRTIDIIVQIRELLLLPCSVLYHFGCNERPILVEIKKQQHDSSCAVEFGDACSQCFIDSKFLTHCSY